MSFQNKKCIQCDSPYHHGNWCGYNGAPYDEDKFCSDFCARMNDQGSQIIKSMELLLSKLSDDEKEILVDILFPNREVTEENCDTSEFNGWGVGEFVGESKFDADLVCDILKSRFGGYSGMQTWGLW